MSKTEFPTPPDGAYGTYKKGPGGIIEDFIPVAKANGLPTEESIRERRRVKSFYNKLRDPSYRH